MAGDRNTTIEGDSVSGDGRSDSAAVGLQRGRQKPHALDLFCGAGGATRGLQLAGFHVTGVDIKPQPRYVGDAFHQADAMTFPLDGFDFIWASPPCQAHTALKKMWNAKVHADLIPQTREKLSESGLPWVIENVPGAPLRFPIRLCGTMFGLKSACGAELRRHRYFESNMMLLAPACSHGRSVVGVYGGHVRDRCRTITVTGHTPQQNVVRNRVRQTFSIEIAKHVMGIDWMTMEGLSQAIPPAYSRYIAEQMMPHVLANISNAPTTSGRSLT